jgi:hypothetical protein
MGEGSGGGLNGSMIHAPDGACVILRVLPKDLAPDVWARSFAEYRSR